MSITKNDVESRVAVYEEATAAKEDKKRVATPIDAVEEWKKQRCEQEGKTAKGPTPRPGRVFNMMPTV